MDRFEPLERTDFRRRISHTCYVLPHLGNDPSIHVFIGGHAISLTTWYKITDHSLKAFQTTIEFPIHFGPQAVLLVSGL